MKARRGFTLIELLVAMFIAAIMFALGYGAIKQALNTHESLKEQQAHLLELQTAVRVLEQDFVQLAPRPVRQAIGNEPAQPALAGGAATTLGSLSSAPTSGAPPIVAFTRAGWAGSLPTACRTGRAASCTKSCSRTRTAVCSSSRCACCSLSES